MANLRFVDGAGDDAKYRKAAGVGSDADPFITDVSISSIAPGSAAASLGKAEDAAHASGDVGVMALSVRQNTAAALSGADADYQPLITDTNGRLHVLDANSAAALTALQLIDDAVKTDDAAFTPATDKVLMIGAQADEAAPDSVDEGDAGALRMTLTRALHVNLRDASGTELAVGGGTQYTEDAAATANPVGNVQILVRKDSPADEVSADGDNIATRGTKYGAAYTQIVSSTGAFIDTFGGGTQYTEDAAAAADPVGTAPILVRKDTPATITSADGDNVAQRGTNYGAAYVQVVSSAGAYVDTFGGGTQYTEDAAAAADPVGTAMILVRKDTPASEVSADGDNVAARGTSKGELYVKHTDALTVNAHAVTNAGVFAVQVDALPAGTNAIGKLAANSGVDIGDVDVLTLPNVTLAAGTNTNEVVGDVAHDAAIAGNPLTVGGVASAAAPSDVSADQDAVRAWFLRNGAQATVITAAGALIGGDATNGLDVDVTRSALPTGAATEATLNSIKTATEKIDDAIAGSEMQVDVVAALPAGDFNIGNVDIVTVPAPLSTTGGGTEATALRVTIATDSTGVVGLRAIAAGGYTTATLLSAATTNATSVKASAGKIGFIYVNNANASARFLKFYNKASAPTVGTDTPVLTFPIPPGYSGVLYSGETGLAFSTGIAYATTTGVATADTGAVAANEIVVNLGYA